MEGKSNWYIITGGPSSGKKTILKLLEGMGYRVIREVARGVINRANRQGITTKILRKDEVKFQESLLPLKLKLERKLPRGEVIFWNRAMPDSIAYIINCHGDHEKVSALCEPDLYRKVFLLRPLHMFTPDDARTEDTETARKLDWLLQVAYQEAGYRIISVLEMSPIPQLSIAKRLAFILSHVYEEEVIDGKF